MHAEGGLPFTVVLRPPPLHSTPTYPNPNSPVGLLPSITPLTPMTYPLPFMAAVALPPDSGNHWRHLWHLPLLVAPQPFLRPLDPAPYWAHWTPDSLLELYSCGLWSINVCWRSTLDPELAPPAHAPPPDDVTSVFTAWTISPLLWQHCVNWIGSLFDDRVRLRIFCSRATHAMVVRLSWTFLAAWITADGPSLPSFYDTDAWWCLLRLRLSRPLVSMDDAESRDPFAPF